MDVGVLPGSIEDAIALLRDETDPQKVIAREVLEEARDGKIAPEDVQGETYVRQQAALAGAGTRGA